MKNLTYGYVHLRKHPKDTQWRKKKLRKLHQPHFRSPNFKDWWSASARNCQRSIRSPLVRYQNRNRLSPNAAVLMTLTISQYSDTSPDRPRDTCQTWLRIFWHVARSITSLFSFQIHWDSREASVKFQICMQQWNLDPWIMKSFLFHVRVHVMQSYCLRFCTHCHRVGTD